MNDGTAFLKIEGTDLCLGADGDTDGISTQICDTSNGLQRWKLNGGSATWDSKFELQPVADTTLCATNTHHPKFGEIIFFENCAIPRYDQTSYWQMYEAP